MRRAVGPQPDRQPGLVGVVQFDVQGAAQVLASDPEALLIFLDAPSVDEQRVRLEGRGDPPEAVAERLAKGAEERDLAQSLGAIWVTNDDLDRTIGELEALIAAARDARAGGRSG